MKLKESTRSELEALFCDDQFRIQPAEEADGAAATGEGGNGSRRRRRTGRRRTRARTRAPTPRAPTPRARTRATRWPAARATRRRRRGRQGREGGGGQGGEEGGGRDGALQPGNAADGAGRHVLRQGAAGGRGRRHPVEDAAQPGPADEELHAAALRHLAARLADAVVAKLSPNVGEEAEERVLEDMLGYEGRQWRHDIAIKLGKLCASGCRWTAPRARQGVARAQHGSAS